MQPLTGTGEADALRRLIDQPESPRHTHAREMDNADISEIVEGKLYLGSKDPAADLAALQRRGVTHVVNCTADGIEGAVPNHHERDGVLAYYRLPLLDGPKCSLLPLLPTALDWAVGAVEGGGVVFAHCHAGSSRSGAFVCAFLMATQQLSFADAWASARAKRPVVKPNAGFKAHLRAYQSMVDGVPPAPTPTEVELAVDAQEFADAEMMARMQRGEEWGEWTGYDEFKGAFAVALRRGETDWRQVEERLQDAEEGEPPPPVLSLGGDPDAAAGLGRTSSFRFGGESIEEYEERLCLMAAAAAEEEQQEQDDADADVDELALLASLPAPPGIAKQGGGSGGGGVGGGAGPEEVEVDELWARLEWLKQLHAEDGAPLDHTYSSSGGGRGGGGGAADNDVELELRFARLQQMQQQQGDEAHPVVPGPELEPEPEPDGD